VRLVVTMTLYPHELIIQEPWLLAKKTTTHHRVNNHNEKKRCKKMRVLVPGFPVLG